MNLLLWLAILLGTALGSGYLGFGLGRDSEVAAQARITSAIDATYDKALAGTSEAISRMKVNHVTVNRRLETIVRENRVFTDCRSGPDSVRLFNEGIEGAGKSADRGELPPSHSSAR